MLNKTFYHASIKRYVTLFGTIFNDIWINRYDSAGNAKHSFKVPIQYGPREKFLARVANISTKDPQKQPFSIILPRMGFEIVGINYAPERKLPTSNKIAKADASNEQKKKYLWNSVPYDISFQLSIMVKNTEDGTMIVEQILPYFSPDWTPTVQIIDDPVVSIDVPLILNGSGYDHIYEGSYEERGTIVWTLDFTMKARFYGPKNESGIIKLANVNFFDTSGYDDIDSAVGNDDPAARVTIYPGQDANGNATTLANNTVSSNNISEDENWGYITAIDDPIQPEE